jgi:hypothetical protein
LIDYVPFPAHLREKKQRSSLIESTPIVGIRQQGSSVGFCYAKLGVGESISMAEDETDFRAVASSGQRIWNEVEPNIFEKVKTTGFGRP